MMERVKKKRRKKINDRSTADAGSLCVGYDAAIGILARILLLLTVVENYDLSLLMSSIVRNVMVTKRGAYLDLHFHV